jgi:hypothetical protein
MSHLLARNADAPIAMNRTLPTTRDRPRTEHTDIRNTAQSPYVRNCR